MARFVLSRLAQAISPGLFLSRLVLGFVVLGDVLRDVLDPQRRA